jgi:hypothetical protein
MSLLGLIPFDHYRFMVKTICVLLFINISIYSQSDSSDLVVNRFGNHQYLKSKKELMDSRNKSLTDGNLIIQLDTFQAKYTKDKYFVWNKLPITSNFRMPILDADNNGKLECYGVNIFDTLGGQVYELKNPPKLLYKFADSFRCFWDAASIKGDGTIDLVGSGDYNKMLFYKQGSPNSLITQPDFVFNPNDRTQQPENLTFYDIDGDGVQELIFFVMAGTLDSAWGYSNIVAKYNPLINNYEIVYYNRPQPDNFTFGILTGDFDNNGKRNFATGSIDGKMYVYEYVNGNNYKIEFQQQMECYNLYLQGYSHDMDGNGKPELWVAGDVNSSAYGGLTRIFAFEPTGNDSYEQVYQIDIRGLFDFSIGDIRVADFDGDGKEELMVRNGGYMFFFKNRGLKDYYCDFIYEDPMVEVSNVSDWGVDAMDLDKDGIPELLSFNTVNGYPSYEETLILKRSKILDVSNEEDNLPHDFELNQNYPNPFNGMTKIKFSVPKQSNVRIIIRDLLGRAIKTLLSESRNRGVYETVWDGMDDNHCSVSSGVYFVSMESSGYNKSLKLILLK